MRYLQRINKELFSKSTFENLSSARAFLAKNEIPEDAEFIAIKDLLKSNPGYIFTFTKFFYNDRATFDSLKYLYNLIKQLGRKIGELPKQIDKYESYEKLLDDIMRIEEHTRFNKIVSELPANLKKEAREDDSYFSLIATMSDNVYKDYYHLMKTKSFSFKTFDELYQATIAHTDSYVNMSEVLKQIEEADGATLYYNESNIVIAIIDTEVASKKLGSVSWCISSRGMWNNYNSPEKMTVQYFVWNFGVQYSSNDFRLGTTINSNGDVKTSHLKDDGFVTLSNYCSTYKLNLEEIFKPITKEAAILRVKKGLRMTKELFGICVELDIWQNLTDEIPFEWRLLRGLTLETDELTPIQKLIAFGTLPEALEFTKGPMEFEQDYQRYMFLNRFNLDDEDDGDEIIEKILKPLVYNGDKKLKYNTIRQHFDFFINVELPIEDYYDTISTEYASYVHHAGYYNDNMDGFFDYSEEEQYFSSYLSNTQQKQLINLMNSIGVELGEDNEEWLSILKKYNLDVYIDDFIYDLSNAAESHVGDAFKREKDKLRFDYDDGCIEMGCENIIELISTKFDTLGDYTLQTLIESDPNDTVDLPEYISMGEYIHDEDTKEAGDKLIDKIEEHIENNDDLKDQVVSYKKFRDMIDKLGFNIERNRITKDTSEYNIVINSYNSEESTVKGAITDIKTDIRKEFKIPLDELPSYMGNHKLDLFFESLKY